jgi:mRNA-degrading endonuclease RelE of RelBE toxin-antitoxin system
MHLKCTRRAKRLGMDSRALVQSLDAAPLNGGSGKLWKCAPWTQPPRDSEIRVVTDLFEGILRFARTGSGEVNALHGDMAGEFRLRLGDYRVLFTLQDDAMRIFGVRHRSQAYRGSQL